ncbi:neuroligin-4, X-linked-like [Mercenaria mercenaria]|uniref:neuroligin-4, X-linked-like n=1 Tax=Mercenaria mercenaria TaxID=6596 RepID=UPI00234F1AA4|nr:neuroligin-4, X-linked-like [Mercenaria mercenaria]
MDFAQYAGCGGLSHVLTLQCLRNKSSGDIRTATEAYEASEPVNLVNKTWVPVYDGDFVLTKTDQLLEEMGSTPGNSKFTTFHDVDLMIGATKMDGNVFLGNWLTYINESSYGPMTDFFNVTAEQFENVVIPMAAAISLREKPCLPSLEAIKIEYTDWENPGNLTYRLQNLINIGTDFGLNAPSVATARAHTNSNTSTYMYQFATASPRTFLPIPPMLLSEQSAGHADEVGFVFGFPLALLVPFGASLSSVTAEQMKVSKAVMAMWSNFAKTRNPNTPMDLQSIYSNLQWPSYDIVTESYLKITSNMGANSAGTRLAARAVEFWNDLLPSLQSLGKQ